MAEKVVKSLSVNMGTGVRQNGRQVAWRGLQDRSEGSDRGRPS